LNLISGVQQQHTKLALTPILDFFLLSEVVTTWQIDDTVHISQIRYSLVVILELIGVSEVQYKGVMMIDDGKYQ